MNNHIWFYDLGKKKTDTAFLLGDREYMAEVNNVQLNEDFCAVLCGGHIMLHTVSQYHSVIVGFLIKFIQFFRLKSRIQ